MIAFLSGTVALVEDDALVLDVGGVGYRVFTAESVRLAAERGHALRLFTHQHVREDAILLYGFAADEERRLFVRLQSATGVGPKLALQMLGSLSAEQIVRAIQSEDVGVLTTVPGIGAKTARRLALELRDRIDDLAGALSLHVQETTTAAQAAAQRAPDVPPHLEEARAALLALGFQEREALHALAAFAAEEALPTAEVVRRALRGLAR